MIEKHDIYRGHKYWVASTPLGHRCGYVLSKKDEIRENNYNLADSLFPGIHGGITFVNHFVPQTGERYKTLVLGFDCGHYEDGVDATLLPPEYPAILSMNNPGDHVWTTEDVEAECKHLINLMESLGW